MDRLPLCSLTSVGLATCSDCGLCDSIAGHANLPDRCHIAIRHPESHTIRVTTPDRSVFGAGVYSSEGPRSRRDFLRRDDAAVVENPQTAVQPLERLHPGSGVARTLIVGHELQCAPATPQRVVPGDLPGSACSRRSCRGGCRDRAARYASSGSRADTLSCTLKRGRNSRSTLLASAIVDASVRRISVTSLSWKVPAMRPTRPLA